MPNKVIRKVDLAMKIAAQTDLDERAARSILNLILSLIIASIKRGEKVNLTGFGAFDVRKKKRRTMRNPQTGEPLVVPAHKSVGFVPGQNLKYAVRKKA